MQSWLQRLDRRRLERHVRFLAADPLPCRTLNFRRPGQTHSTLHEADAYLENELAAMRQVLPRQAAYSIVRELVPVQAFQPDATVAHGFRKPLPQEPWYGAVNLYARKTGHELPQEVILLLAHKDSQSWLAPGPGAHDNACGTAAVLEIARVLAPYPAQRSLWFLFCNEEHWPWTSVAAAQQLAASGMQVTAVINIDSIGGVAASDRAAGRMSHVTRYSTPAGKRLAGLMVALNQKHRIGLRHSIHELATPNDDDGSFIAAGIEPAVMAIGSYPYAEPHYHTPEDRPEYVDFANVALSAQLCLAAVLHLDAHGAP